MLLLYQVKLHHILVYPTGSFTASWSHHHTNRLVPGIRSASKQSSYMGHQATLSAMVACRLLMYTPIGWIPLASIASTTVGYSHSPPALCLAFITVICLAVCWWNPSSTLMISTLVYSIIWNQSLDPYYSIISLWYILVLLPTPTLEYFHTGGLSYSPPFYIIISIPKFNI